MNLGRERDRRGGREDFTSRGERVDDRRLGFAWEKKEKKKSAQREGGGVRLWGEERERDRQGERAEYVREEISRRRKRKKKSKQNNKHKK